MKGKTTFWACTITILILCLADGALTYIATPDLSLEGNPLVAYWGLGWPALFVANLLFIALFVAAAHYAFVKYKGPVISAKTYVEYMCILAFNQPGKFIWLLYKLPKNWKPFGAMMGYAGCFSFIIGRSIVVLEWVLHLSNSHLSDIYQTFRSHLFWHRIDILCAILSFTLLIIYWTIKEYRNNQTTTHRPHD